MEEVKKNKKKVIIIAVLFLLLAIIGLLVITGLIVFLWVNKVEETYISDSMSLKRYRGNDYYITNDDYSGEYDLQIFSSFDILHNKEPITEFEKKEVLSYEDYEAYCNRCDIEKIYSDSSKNYIVISQVLYDSAYVRIGVADVKLNDNSVDLYIRGRTNGGTEGVEIVYYLIIPLEKGVDNLNIIDNVYTEMEFEEIRKLNYPGRLIDSRRNEVVIFY